MKNLPCIVVLAAFVTGCTTTHEMVTPFNESDYQPFAGKGTATIAGQVFLKPAGGNVRFGAGDTVSLIPVTPYTTEAMTASRSDESPSLDPRLQKYIRRVVADGDGDFEFQNIPPGSYYIQCPIFWDVQVGYGNRERAGGFVYAQTQVNGGETIRVMVTRQ